MSKRIFTLIEIIVAMAVLTLSLTGLFQLLGSSQSKLAGALEKWHHMHMATQAAEYVLMHADENVELPVDFFPYRGYTVNISFDDAAGLPDEFSSQTDQLPLRRCIIELERDRDREIVETITVDRLGDDTTTSQ